MIALDVVILIILLIFIYEYYFRNNGIFTALKIKIRVCAILLSNIYQIQFHIQIIKKVCTILIF